MSDYIVFASDMTINLVSTLPELDTGDDWIDGVSRIIQVNGGGTGAANFHCFSITSPENQISVLRISNCNTAILVSPPLGTASSSIIGGPDASYRNVISSNRTGVHISGENADSVTVSANYIGVDAAGSAAAGNQVGVRISGGADNNIIGGTTVGRRNIISGNSFYGVEILDNASTGNVIQGNYIGLNAAGTGALPNASGGVLVYDANANTIGGTTGTTPGGSCTGACNVISGNNGPGIIFNNAADSNVIRGNYVVPSLHPSTSTSIDT